MRSFIAAAALAASTLASPADYDNTNNGATWEATDCVNGRQQSPIDLYNAKHSTEGFALWMEDYSPAGDVPEKVAGAESDFTWKYNYAENQGHLTLMKQEWTERRAYKSLQFHFHSPSEHTIDGELLDAEMHIVHQNPDTKEIAVVGFMFDVVEGAKSNWFIQQMMAHFEDSSSQDVDMGKLIAGIDTSKFWSYDGSFTTPPCTEGVMWSVLSEVQEISQEQLDEFQKVYTASASAKIGNNRAIQPLNDRVLYHAMSDGKHMDKDHDKHMDKDHDEDMWEMMMDMWDGASTTVASLSAIALAITAATF